MRSRLLGSIFALLGAALLSAKAADLPPEVRIGLQDNLGPDFLIESFAPTMRLLRGEHPETRFKTTIYTPEELSRAVRERRVDAFFADSALFGVLQLESGAQQIAARTAPYVEDPSKAAGIAVVVRRGSPIRTLSDVPGKRIASETPGDFSTWLAFRGLLNGIGALEPGWDAEVRFTGYMPPDPILLVQQAAVDVAVVPACRLESLVAMNVVREGELVVLGDNVSDGFPCRHSAPLLPDIVFGVSTGTSADLASTLSVTLLGAKPFRAGERWRIASDFTKAADLYRELRIGPYRPVTEEPTLLHFWLRYKQWIVAVFLALMLLALHSVAAERLVEKRTRALRAAIDEKERAAATAREARERLTQLERSSVVSGLSSMFAHEVRQPLSAVVAYAGGIRMAAERLGTTSPPELGPTLVSAADQLICEAERVSDIVERVRSYAKAGARRHRPVELAGLVARAREIFGHGSLGEGVDVRIDVPDALSVSGEPLELELVLVNLFRNAASAMAERPSGRRTIRVEGFECRDLLSRENTGNAHRTESAPRFATLEVSDEGSPEGPMAEEVFRRLSTPVKSLKPDSLGLGLHIVRRIVEAHGGSLAFRRAAPPSNGLTVQIRLPMLVPARENTSPDEPLENLNPRLSEPTSC